jgi:hypothetical protein
MVRVFSLVTAFFILCLSPAFGEDRVFVRRRYDLKAFFPVKNRRLSFGLSHEELKATWTGGQTVTGSPGDDELEVIKQVIEDQVAEGCWESQRSRAFFEEFTLVVDHRLTIQKKIASLLDDWKATLGRDVRLTLSQVEIDRKIWDRAGLQVGQKWTRVDDKRMAAWVKEGKGKVRSRVMLPLRCAEPRMVHEVFRSDFVANYLLEDGQFREEVLPLRFGRIIEVSVLSGDQSTAPRIDLSFHRSQFIAMETLNFRGLKIQSPKLNRKHFNSALQCPWNERRVLCAMPESSTVRIFIGSVGRRKRAVRARSIRAYSLAFLQRRRPLTAPVSVWTDMEIGPVSRLSVFGAESWLDDLDFAEKLVDSGPKGGYVLGDFYYVFGPKKTLENGPVFVQAKRKKGFRARLWRLSNPALISSGMISKKQWSQIKPSLILTHCSAGVEGQALGFQSFEESRQLFGLLKEKRRAGFPIRQQADPYVGRLGRGVTLSIIGHQFKGGLEFHCELVHGQFVAGAMSFNYFLKRGSLQLNRSKLKIRGSNRVRFCLRSGPDKTPAFIVEISKIKD